MWWDFGLRTKNSIFVRKGLWEQESFEWTQIRVCIQLCGGEWVKRKVQTHLCGLNLSMVWSEVKTELFKMKSKSSNDIRWVLFIYLLIVLWSFSFKNKPKFNVYKIRLYLEGAGEGKIALGWFGQDETDIGVSLAQGLDSLRSPGLAESSL